MIKVNQDIPFFIQNYEGFMEMDRNKRILDVNPEMCRILASNREKIFGRYFFEFIDEEDKIKLQSQSNISIDAQRNTFNLTLRREDKTPVHCLVNASTICDENRNWISSLVFITDMSELCKVETRLRRVYPNQVRVGG